jgi:2-polyprenyl-6-methoxyphenol hydroxylase-like FAD-dependent oxidoreductase
MIGVGGFAESPSAAPSDADDVHRLTFNLGPRLQFGYATFSYPDLLWGWWSHLPQETEPARQALQEISDDEMRARILAAFRGWHRPIEALISATPIVTRTAIYDVPTLPAWHRGRVMLLGDAAHAMSPAGGQGASLALEDAMVAGSRLAAGRRFDEVFIEVERLLRSRAERLVKRAADNDARQVKQLGIFGQWMRDRLFPLLVPFIGRDLERQYAALRHEVQAA